METNGLEILLNSDILKLFVVLLAVVVIIFLFLRCKRDDTNSKIHMYYISGLCVFIILELVTYVCVNNDNTTDIVSYISFASTLSSLFLSVVAIIYAIVSNNKGEAQYQKIDSASDRISISVDRFSHLSENLSGNINSILLKLEELKVMSSEMRDAVSRNNQQMNNQQNYSLATQQVIDNVLDFYVKNGSYWGNLSLLACIYSSEKNRPFTANEIIPDNPGYALGYIVSSSALGLFISYVKDNDQIIVEQIQPGLKEKLIENIESFISKKPEYKDYNQKYLTNIKNLFGVIE